MNRNEAVTYLKEVLNACNNMSPDAVSFEKPPKNDETGYIVHIKGSMHESDKTVVKDIAKRHSLKVREDQDELVVFRSKLHA